MKSAGSGGVGCLVLFGLIFTLAGLVPGALALSSVWDWMQARDWIEVQAQVLEAGLDRRDETFRATASYRYRYQGIVYEGNRVSFHGGGDNIGDFHDAMFRLLERHRVSGEPLNIFIDPHNPAAAVIHRDLRPGMIGFLMVFPLLFGAAGIGIVLYALTAGRRRRKSRALQQSHPDEPWRWRAEWSSGVLPSDNGKMLKFMGFFALVWNLISLPLPFMLWREVTAKANPAALIGLVFPLVGLGLILWLGRLWLADRRYGRATFTLDTLPAALGDRLSGEFMIPASLPAGSMLRVHLDCVRRRTTGSGRHRSTTEDLLWQDEQRLPLQPHHLLQGTRVHLVFPLPADQPPSDDTDPENRVLWRLRAEADVPGVDFSALFEVPVFRVATGTRATELSPAVSEAAEPADWRRTGVEPRYGTEGLEYYFAPARHRGIASGLTLIALVFSGATLALWLADQPLMALIFGLFSLLLLWASLHTWLIRSRLVPGHGRLRLRRGYTASGKLRDIGAAELSAITFAPGMRAGHTQYYDLIAELAEGRRIRLADMLRGRRDSEALARHLSAAIGLHDHKPV